MKQNEKKCDLILNTVGATHEVSDYLGLLKTEGTIVQLGLVDEPHHLKQVGIILRRLKIAGSFIGGIEANEDLL